MFEVKTFEPPMQEMAAIIVQAAKLVVEAVPLLSAIGSNAGRLNALTGRIIAVEEQADEVHDRGLKALFLASRQENKQGQRDRSIYRRHGDLRPSGKSRRSIRGCLERNKLNRCRSAIADRSRSHDPEMNIFLSLPVLIALIAVALAFDFLNGLQTPRTRSPRWCRRACCGRLRGAVGGVVQLHRLFDLRRARGAHSRRRHHLRRCRWTRA